MRNKWFGLVLGISVIFMAYQAWAENIAISTYYPSPYGSYTQLDAVTLNGTTVVRVGPLGAPTITMTGATGALTATGAITGATVSGTTSVSSGANISLVAATGAITATSLQTTGNIIATGGIIANTNGVVRGVTLQSGDGGAATTMTLTRTPVAGAGHLQTRQIGNDYYCQAVYA